MKFLLAPDSFKGSISSPTICALMKKAIQEVDQSHRVVSYPLADGGEGSIKVLHSVTGGEFIHTACQDALGRAILAPYLRKDERAFIELAQASGLERLQEKELNPMRTSTYGTGLQIMHALDAGASEIVLTIGGSATNDFGLGIAAALGYDFYENDEQISFPTGADLHRINRVCPPENLPQFSMMILCDVQNPLFGPDGAAHTYAAQKGADSSMVLRLENGLVQLMNRLGALGFQDVRLLPGSGAAGGVGGGMVTFFGAELVSGIGYLIENLGLKDHLHDCDWVLTGEGKLDEQTLKGKTIKGLVKAAERYQVPVIALCGLLELSASQVHELGLHAAYQILDPIPSMEVAIANTAENIGLTTTRIVRQLSLFKTVDE